MGNSCIRQTPNITLSCVNSGMVSSCCRNELKEEEGDATVYQWVYTCVNEKGCFCINESKTSFMDYDDCKYSAMADYQKECNSWVHFYIYQWKVSSNRHLTYDRVYINPLETEV